jgi:hypothetical protein
MFIASVPPGVNPLAGCLPTLATIPVFIGLYRALTLAAQDNLLDQVGPVGLDHWLWSGVCSLTV